VEVDVGLGFGFGGEAGMDRTSGAIGDTLVLVGRAVLEPDEVLASAVETSTIGSDVSGGVDAINESVATSRGVRGTRGTSTAINDGVGVHASMEELGGNESQLTEVAFEVVDGRLDDVRVAVTIDVNLRGERGFSLRVDEVGELTLEGSTNDGFMVLELTSLLVDRGHDVLNVVFTELVNSLTSADDGRSRGAEVLADRTDGLGLRAVLLLGIVGLSQEAGLNPSGQASGAVRSRAVVEGRKDVGREGKFHRTLEVDGSLSQLTAEFILNASDVQEVLRQVRDVDSPAEHVDVVFHFFPVAKRVLLECRVGGRIRRVDVSAVKDAKFDGRVWVAVDLPAERSIPWLGTTLSHRGDGRVLGVDVCDEVREFFTDTDTTRGKAVAGRTIRKRTLILELGLE